MASAEKANEAIEDLKDAARNGTGKISTRLLNSVAKDYGLNPAFLSRKFEEATGKPYSVFSMVTGRAAQKLCKVVHERSVSNRFKILREQWQNHYLPVHEGIEGRTYASKKLGKVVFVGSRTSDKHGRIHDLIVVRELEVVEADWSYLHQYLPGLAADLQS